MTNLQEAVSFAKSQLSKDYIFIHVKPDILQTLVEGLEELQTQVERQRQIRYNATEAHINVQSKLQTEKEELEDALQYAMNQIQIKSDYIRRLETDIEDIKNKCGTLAKMNAASGSLLSEYERIIRKMEEGEHEQT